MNLGKNIKILGVRQSLIGDCLMSLPVLNFVERSYPLSYKYWHIAKKCSQCAPLFYNHPLIDKIIISDCEEGFGPRDLGVAKECRVVFDTAPQHPFGEYWHNHRSMVEETWVMAGIPLEQLYTLPEEERSPKLYKWFDTQKYDKTIAIHCFAGYGRDNQRSPSIEWWEKLLWDLSKDYKIIRLGHPNEPRIRIGIDNSNTDYRNLSFLEQIQIALGCSAYIGTDSGFSLAMGAYSHPQVTLLTNWNIAHTENPLCLQPINKNNVSLFNKFDNGGCSGIIQEKVLDSIKLLL